MDQYHKGWVELFFIVLRPTFRPVAGLKAQKCKLTHFHSLTLGVGLSRYSRIQNGVEFVFQSGVNVPSQGLSVSRIG